MKKQKNLTNDVLNLFEYKKTTSSFEKDDKFRKKIITEKPEKKMLIKAGPGTGKTHSLIEKIKYMAENYDIEPADEMLVLCFSRTAVKEIKERFYEEIARGGLLDSLSYLNIRTFDSFATQLLIYMDIDTNGKDYDERIEMAIDVIEEEPHILENLGHLFVDEIQDLVGPRARFVQSLLINSPGGFSLFGDPLQGIYDYQIKDSFDLSSDRFISWVQTEFTKSIEVVSLYENKRQVPKLSEYSLHARNLLENSNGPKIKEFFDMLKKLTHPKDIKKIDSKIFENKKIGILCRTNGEVLEVSDHLRKVNINHLVKSRSSVNRHPIWLERLIGYEEINIRTLNTINNELGCWNKNQLERVCKLLLSVNKGDREYTSTRTLLTNLLNGKSLPDELYEFSQNDVIITTIHQSKGKEYDYVYFLESSIGTSDSFEEWQEAKLYYVAITRAKIEMCPLNPLNTGKIFLKKTRNSGRWLKIEKTNKWRVRSLEVGMDYDIAEESFISKGVFSSVVSNQNYIRNSIKEKDEVTLKREKDDSYGIYHKDKLIGKMSDSFTRDLKVSFKEIYGRKMQYLPAELKGLYVDRVYTITKRPETLGLEVDEHYGASGVWLGVHILGLGNINWSID